MPENSQNESQAPQTLRVDAGPEHKLIETSLQKRDAVVIGRGTECDLMVHDAKASRRHCQLTRQGNAFLLTDLDSKNGTYVNGQRITEPVLLQSKETFKIGDTIFYLA